MVRTVAGMPAFALPFDQAIVTTFTNGQQTTLPIWMLSELVRPPQRPLVFVITVTLVPVLVAYRVTRGTETVAGRGKQVPRPLHSVVLWPS